MRCPTATSLRRRWRKPFGQSETFEDLLDRARMFGREHMFLVGVRIISGTVSAKQAGEVYAALADVLIRAMRKAAEDRFIADHGKLKKQEAAVLALGKLGGREMTAGSDLDLMVVYDFDGDAPESDGKRKLPGSQYFARLTQRIVNALTVRTNYGQLYHVDMRLRPSGNSGPVATSLDAFSLYQREEAWTWEHMALTRARSLSASPAFADADRQDHPRRAVSRHAMRTGSLPISSRCVARWRPERGDTDRWNIKNAAGGLLDVEFLAQYLQLVHAKDHPDILPDRNVPCAGEGGRARSARARRRGTIARCGARCITISRKFCGFA